MNASIITIGDEILIGQIQDTNTSWLASNLSDIGIAVTKTWSVGDKSEEIILALTQSTSETDIVFVTGGLGPTKDDITKKALADFLGVEMYFDNLTFERIKRIFDTLGREMSPNHHDQCLMPVGTQILKNSMGTAPGMLLRYKAKLIISMPGVPYEMKAIMNDEVIPMLSKMSETIISHKTILTCCTGETVIENNIGDIVDKFPENIKIAYLPSLAQVRLRLTAIGDDKNRLDALVTAFTTQISDRLGGIVYGYDDSTLEKELYKLCTSKNIKVSTAESCTGGLIASRIVSVPGSSIYFEGGIVAYSNEIKHNILDVKKATIESYGAVSEQTVIEMVDGALKVLKTDVAVAVSGIAGPDGGSTEKPVGTIWISAGNSERKISYLLKTGKDRNKNIEIATTYALNLLRKFIAEIA